MDSDGNCGLGNMTTNHQINANHLDPRLIQRIAEKVVARLATEQRYAAGSETVTSTHLSGTGRSATYLQTKVVSADQVTQLPKNVSVLFTRHDAVITPAAFDEAKQRKIEINRVESQPEKLSAVPEGSSQIIDSAQPNRAIAVAKQLQKRGLGTKLPRIILSETPSWTLHNEIHQHGAIATMVGAIEEVTRFAKELQVDTWVLDMKRLNLISAVNVAAAIARLEA